jgi:hypothetical protein
MAATIFKGDHLRKNLLLWNYWANLNQTLLRWSLGGPLSKLCGCGGHLGRCSEMTDTILEEDHPRIISAKFGCSILSQKVPKFELYKHNDELFNIYYRIFYELWTFTDFDLSSFRGEDFFLISSPLFSNLHNRSISAKFQSS